MLIPVLYSIDICAITAIKGPWTYYVVRWLSSNCYEIWIFDGQSLGKYMDHGHDCCRIPDEQMVHLGFKTSARFLFGDTRVILVTSDVYNNTYLHLNGFFVNK